MERQCQLIGLWEKEEGITIKEKRSKAKKKHTFKGKVKIAGKEKTSVNNTNASSSEGCLEKSILLLNYRENGEIPFWVDFRQI
ncbi:2057_t:CDS:2 [Gigaspora rosea]|nr:2057_t:CDS:2 [Gigaspora rosea]